MEPLTKKEIETLKLSISSIFRRRPHFIVYNPDRPNVLAFTSIHPDEVMLHRATIDTLVHYVDYTDNTMDLFRRMYSPFIDLTKIQYMKGDRIYNILNNILKTDVKLSSICRDGRLTYLIVNDVELGEEEEDPLGEDVVTVTADEDELVELPPPKKFMSHLVDDVAYDALLDFIQIPVDSGPDAVRQVDLEVFRGKEVTVLQLDLADGFLRIPYVDGHNSISRIELIKKLNRPFTLEVRLHRSMGAVRCMFVAKTEGFTAFSYLPAAVHFVRKLRQA